MLIVFVLLIWMLCTLGGAKIMESKGRSVGMGAVLGLLFGVFGLIACACFSKTLDKRAEEAAYLRSILKD